MKLRIVTILACALVVAPAVGQVEPTDMTINDVAVPQNEDERVQNHCNTLAAAERMSLAEGTGEAAQGQGDHEENPNGEGGAPDNPAGQGNEAAITDFTSTEDAAEDTSEVAEENWTVDLDTVTLESCIEAGVSEPVE